MALFLSSASGCGSAKNADAAQDAAGEVAKEVVEEISAETPGNKVPTGTVNVKIETPMGDMVALLYDDTPLHRDNFIKLTEEGFYNDLLWHRVIEGFMIQGGDPQSKGAAPGQRLGSGGPGYTIEAEIQDHIYHKKGALSAARQGDQVNPQKRSSGSQFYVVQGKPTPQDQLLMFERQKNARRDSSNMYSYSDRAMEDYATLGGTPFLDAEYTVFGEVIEGLDVIDKIAATQTLPGDRPAEDVTMKISVISK